MKDDYTTNSHYLTYIFNFKRFGRMYFLNLGMKGLKVASFTNFGCFLMRVKLGIMLTLSLPSSKSAFS